MVQNVEWKFLKGCGRREMGSGGSWGWVVGGWG